MIYSRTIPFSNIDSFVRSVRVFNVAMHYSLELLVAFLTTTSRVGDILIMFFYLSYCFQLFLVDVCVLFVFLRKWLRSRSDVLRRIRFMDLGSGFLIFLVPGLFSNLDIIILTLRVCRYRPVFLHPPLCVCVCLLSYRSLSSFLNIPVVVFFHAPLSQVIYYVGVGLHIVVAKCIDFIFCLCISLTRPLIIFSWPNSVITSMSSKIFDSWQH